MIANSFRVNEREEKYQRNHVISYHTVGLLIFLFYFASLECSSISVLLGPLLITERFS